MPACSAELGAVQEMPLRRVLVVDGADHGLEIGDDMPRSLQVMAQVLSAIEASLA